MSDEANKQAWRCLASMCETVQRVYIALEEIAPLIEQDSVKRSLREHAKKLRAVVASAPEGCAPEAPVDVAALVDEFQKAMREDVIPRIVETIRERNKAAAAARLRIIA